MVYPGFCRNGTVDKLSESSMNSVRLLTDNKLIQFDDGLLGRQSYNLEKISGDFILQRRDGYFSYHLASGIDDAEQQITEVVRGADLLNCTPSQIHVQHSLKLLSPIYSHLPVVVDERGQKLSKQSHAKPIVITESVDLLYKSLKFLGQMPPIELINTNKEEIWNWAKEHWQFDSVSNNKAKNSVLT